MSGDKLLHLEYYLSAAAFAKTSGKFGVFSAKQLIDKVISSINNWAEFADEAGVSDLSKDLVAGVICR